MVLVAILAATSWSAIGAEGIRPRLEALELTRNWPPWVEAIALMLMWLAMVVLGEAGAGNVYGGF